MMLPMPCPTVDDPPNDFQNTPLILQHPADSFPPPSSLRHYHSLLSTIVDPNPPNNIILPTHQIPSPSFHAPPIYPPYTSLSNPRPPHADYTTSTSFLSRNNFLQFVNLDHQRLQDIVKRELCSTAADFNSRIGLNLGGRTYFSPDDYALMGAFGKRLRPDSPHVPVCQAEGCKSDLRIAKHYHRRHKVCEYHSKAATVIISGQKQRFCQQCSRFHVLAEFDDGKRSCRKRLADHNRRRRKTQQSPPSSVVSSTTHQQIDESEDIAATHKGTSSKSSPSIDKPQASIPLGHASIPPQTCKVSECSDPKKQDLADMQINCKGPSLSLTTLGGGSHVSTQGQSMEETYGEIDSVSWLRQGNARRGLIEDAVITRCANMDKSDNIAGAQLETVQCSTQNLLQLQDSKDHLSTNDWMMKSCTAAHVTEQLVDFGSSNLITLDRGKSDGPEFLRESTYHIMQKSSD